MKSLDKNKPKELEWEKPLVDWNMYKQKADWRENGTTVDHYIIPVEDFDYNINLLLTQQRTELLEEILNLECLKEEKTYTYFSSPKMNIDVRDITTGKITHWRKDKKYKHQSILTEEQILRNQLRKEIIEEIKKL